ncbi:hypothetical protein OIU77_004709 [Salix suchowensis]|uniref:Uncharacterized protein n=1 Tax=Salix suchowensis TaxID=1278906 RepID=A0ABQ9AY59_9ROSI|nr:hypothetical protein OIU77_004709 [Salix suchowensis]
MAPSEWARIRAIAHGFKKANDFPDLNKAGRRFMERKTLSSLSPSPLSLISLYQKRNPAKLSSSRLFPSVSSRLSPVTSRLPQSLKPS